MIPTNLIKDGVHALAASIQIPVKIVELHSPLGNTGQGICIGTKPAIPLFWLDCNDVTSPDMLDLLRKNGSQRVVFSEHLAPKLTKQLRTCGTQYLDRSGNASIHWHGLHIVVIGKKSVVAPAGRKHLPEKVKTGKAFQPAGLKVIFALLADHELAQASLRTIAERAGVSLGAVSAIIKDLVAHEYLSGQGGQQELLNIGKLVQRWGELYPYRLRDKAHVGRFTAQTSDWWQMLPSDVNYQLSGEIAAFRLTGYLNPKDGILYAADTQLSALMRAGRLRQLKTDEKPVFSIDIYRPFWDMNSDTHIAPALIVASDLLSTGDPRNVDAARRVLNEYVA